MVNTQKDVTKDLRTEYMCASIFQSDDKLTESEQSKENETLVNKLNRK